MRIAQLQEKGWTVRKDGPRNFSLKNGPWNKISGFHTAAEAWAWLVKIQEPRSRAEIEWGKKAKDLEVIKERQRMKSDLIDFTVG